MDYWYAAPEELDEVWRRPQAQDFVARNTWEGRFLTTNHYNVIGLYSVMSMSMNIGQKYWPEPSFDSLTLQEYPGYYNPRGYYRS